MPQGRYLSGVRAQVSPHGPVVSVLHLDEVCRPAQLTRIGFPQLASQIHAVRQSATWAILGLF